MPHLLLLIIIIAFLSTASEAQQTNADTSRLKEVVTGFFNALSELDSAKAKSFCTSDAVILETGKVWNFDSLAARITMRKSMSADFKRINTLHFIHSKINGNTGWVYYFNNAQISFGGQIKVVNWLESVVLINEDNAWKISLLHSTSLDAIK